MSNLFPIGSPQEITRTVTNRIKFGRTWKWDHTRGDFVTSASGRVQECTAHEAWVEWIKKALRTERYRYPVYSRSYGQEFDDLIALHLTRAGNESEIRRIVTETLMRDPRTARVENFTFLWNGDECYYTFDAYSVYNERSTIQESVVNQ